MNPRACRVNNHQLTHSWYIFSLFRHLRSLFPSMSILLSRCSPSCLPALLLNWTFREKTEMSTENPNATAGKSGRKTASRSPHGRIIVRRNPNRQSHLRHRPSQETMCSGFSCACSDSPALLQSPGKREILCSNPKKLEFIHPAHVQPPKMPDKKREIKNEKRQRGGLECIQKTVLRME